MKKIALILFMLINSAYAQKNATQGNLISADTFNSSTLSVGTVQQSILSVVKFQELNGDCWRLMDGSSIVGTDLASLIAPTTTLPDMTAAGMFVRQAANGRAVGSSELDSFASHTHTQDPHSHGQDGHNHLAGHGRAGPPSSYPYANALYGGIASGTGTPPTQGTGNLQKYHAYTSTATPAIYNTTAINQATGGTETKPKNIALNFLIKVNKVCNFNNN